MWWIWIPIIAILAGAFKEWLKFKEKQAQLGTSADELERALAASKHHQEALQRRVENLEAIVTSQMWDVLNDTSMGETERENRLVRMRAEMDAPAHEDNDARRVEQMARRLRV
jgi:hypothetical protein